MTQPEQGREPGKVVILQPDGQQGLAVGVTAGEFVESNRQHVANVVAIARILIEKDLVTEAEFLRIRARALAEVDRDAAAKRSEIVRQLAGLTDEPDSEGPADA